MAVDLDQFPLDDPLIKRGSTYMTDTWNNNLATFFESLIGYLSERGIFMPRVTTAQRDEIQSPQGGQLIYNTTLGTAQYFQVNPVTLIGTWISF